MKNLIRNDWLTSLISKPAYRLEKFNYNLNDNFLKYKNSFIETKINTNDVNQLNAIQRSDFELIECELNFKKSNYFSQNQFKSEVKIRLAKKKDEDHVREIASKSFVKSRFYKDQNFEKKTASKIKEEWAGNFFRGERGDYLIVAEKNNSVIGFLLILIKNDNLIIDLIAVKEESRGLGIAKSMIAFVEENHMKDLRSILVGTQLSNLSAINLYNSLDFRLISSKYAFHLHTNK